MARFEGPLLVVPSTIVGWLPLAGTVVCPKADAGSIIATSTIETSLARVGVGAWGILAGGNSGVLGVIFPVLTDLPKNHVVTGRPIVSRQASCAIKRCAGVSSVDEIGVRFGPFSM